MSDRPFDQNVGEHPTHDEAVLPSAPPPTTTTPAPPPVPMEPMSDDDGQQSTTDVAKDEAASVAQDAKEGAGQVAQTAAQEVRQVADQARSQAQSLLGQVRHDVTSQASGQQQRAAQGLHGLAEEFDKLARGDSEGSTMASGLVGQAAQRLGGVAGWLEEREPADLLEDVKRYARRNPGTFLAICGLVGLVGGRLTRSLRDEASDDDDAHGSPRSGTGTDRPAGYGTTTYAPESDAGLYASTTEVPTAYATRDYPSHLDEVDELPVGEDLLGTREDGERL